MYKCKKCEKSFKSQRALQGHQRVHSENYEKVQKEHTLRLAKNSIKTRRNNIEKYNKNPLHCLECNEVIPYDKTIGNKSPRKFCNHSCSATHTNKLKSPKTQETKDKIRKSLSVTRLKDPLVKKIKNKKVANIFSIKYFYNSICGDYTKIYNLTCSHCKGKFINRSPIKYCKEHSDLYKNNNRNRYAFTFSMSKYPDIFDCMAEQLKEFGMWSYTNTNGLTRDHKISVNEAIRNDYDPYYIRHPLNCELMSWLVNNKKNTQSSLEYEELKCMVDEYENKC